jgi:CAAX prenyl protease-like protein
MFSRAAWARILPFLTYMLFIVAADLLARAGWQDAQLRWLYPAKVAAVAVLLVVFWRHYEELRGPAPSLRLALLSVVVGAVVMVLWISLDASWMVVGQSKGYDPQIDGHLLWPLVLVRWAGAALVVPVMEELFWRSYLMRVVVQQEFQEVTPRQINCQSFIVTVILFGVEHNLWLAGVVAGAAYSLLYMRSGKLWSAIVAHGVTNGILGIWVIFTQNWTYW